MRCAKPVVRPVSLRSLVPVPESAGLSRVLLRGPSCALALLVGACAQFSGIPQPATPAATVTAAPATNVTATAAGAKAAAAPAGKSTPAPARDARASGTNAGADTELVAPPAPLDPAVLQAFEAAVAALRAGRTEEARKGFAALTRSHPELGGPHANLGILLRHAGKPDLAVTELEQAVHDDALQPVYWNQLGIAYREQGQFEKARAAYEKAIALDPNYASPKLNLGVLFDLYLWDGPRALGQYEKYLALTPGGDQRVSKWIADLRNRTRGPVAQGGKEQQ